MDEQGVGSILIVGALGAGGGGYGNEGIVEEIVTDGRIVAMSINIHETSVPYPFMIADARDMPFEDNFVDFALANAIIEHVGDAGDQSRFVAEHSRVARCWAITTPNRWFPIESHTAAIMIHWLPSWRRNRNEFTRLLSLREFKKLLPEGSIVYGRPWSSTFTALYSQ